MALGHGAPAESAVLFSAKLKKSADSVSVDYAIEARTIQFPPNPSGKLVADMQCAIVEYDAGGVVIDTSLIHITNTVSPDQQALLNKARLSANQTIPLKPGAASLTLGVRDGSTGRFGTLEAGLADH